MHRYFCSQINTKYFQGVNDGVGAPSSYSFSLVRPLASLKAFFKIMQLTVDVDSSSY